MSLLEITGLTHSFGDHLLYKGASLSLHAGEHIGITGPNGSGKSTLIRICTGQLLPDAGHILWQPHLRTGCLDQSAQIDRKMALWEYLKSAFSPLYAMEKEMLALYEQPDGGPQALTKAALLQEQLEQADFYNIDSRIQRVAAGLGLAELGAKRPIGQMSGGQRAKAILAKLLLERPDVLLLDEPTNFLDKEHTAWLAGYLPMLENAYLVVSHDEAFLEKISSHIVDISQGSIQKYAGSYAQFLKKKEFMQQEQQRRYAAQQKEIQKTEAFIRKNIAGQRTKMAQGRRKQLERMQRLKAAAPPPVLPRFTFLAEQPGALLVSRLTAGYQEPILSEISFTLHSGEKAVITGFNGIGKSTLLKTLTGRLPALGGSFHFSHPEQTGYFEQEPDWRDTKNPPLEILCRASGLSPREAHMQLARYGISTRLAGQPVGTLSGGEQAKLRLCLLGLRPYSLLILDEPFNHLDPPAKQALEKALGAFSGTVLLVSHEQAFYQKWAQKVIAIK